MFVANKSIFAETFGKSLRLLKTTVLSVDIMAWVSKWLNKLWALFCVNTAYITYIDRNDDAISTYIQYQVTGIIIKEIYISHIFQSLTQKTKR